MAVTFGYRVEWLLWWVAYRKASEFDGDILQEENEEAEKDRGCKLYDD